MATIRSRIIFAILLFLFHLEASAQLLDTLIISMEVRTGGFESFVNAMEDKYPVRIFYREEWVNQIRIDTNYRQKRLPEVLEDVLDHTGLSYMTYKSNIVIVPEYSTISVNDGKPANGNRHSDRSVMTVGNPVNKGRYQVAEVSGTIRNDKDGG